MREDNKKLDAENNFFHMSTTIFIKLKPVMETEKQLCYQLAEHNKQSDKPGYEQRQRKLEAGIAKCRDTISVMEVKLKKVLERVKQAGQATHSIKKSVSPTKQRVPKLETSHTSSFKKPNISSFIALEGTEVILDDEKSDFDLNPAAMMPDYNQKHSTSQRQHDLNDAAGAVDFTSTSGLGTRTKHKVATSTRNRDYGL